MARRASQPRNEIVLTHPTPIIEAALKTKQQPFTVQSERRALRDIPGPSLTFRETIVIGEAAILGWIDRRYPLPSLFPADIDSYAKAATLAHALENDPSQARGLFDLITSPQHIHNFLLGASPTIADLALQLALEKVDPDAAEQFGDALYRQTDAVF